MMKNTSIFFLSFLFSFPLFGQFEWVGDYGYSSELGGFLKTKDNKYVLVRHAQDDAGFTVLDSTGYVIYEYSDDYFLNGSFCGVFYENQGSMSFGEPMELPDSSVAMIMSRIECNTQFSLGNSCLGVQKFDENWAETPFLPCYDVFSSGFGWEQGAVFSDGSLMLIDGGYTMGRGSMQEEYIWTTFSFNFPQPFNDVTVGHSDVAYIASEGGVLAVGIDGAIDTVYEKYILHVLEAMPDGNLLGAKTDSLFLFSPAMEVLSAQQFGGDDVVNFYMDSTQIAVLTKSPHVYFLDEQLNITNEMPIPDGYAPGYITLDHDGVVLAGTECYGNDTQFERTCTPYLKKISLDGSAPEWNKDVGVTAIEQPILPTGAFIPTGDYKLLYDSLKVTVHNFGSEMVDSLKLNAHFPLIPNFGPGCEVYWQLYHKKFTDLSLEPGESIDLIWDNFQILFAQKPNGTFDICIWTSLPDQRLDNENINDRFCADFLVNENELIKEEAAVLKIYPNPSSSATTVEFGLLNAAEGQVRVFNSMGVLVEAFDVEQGSVLLQLPRFGTGLFYVSLEVEGQVVRTEKLVQF